jgi:ferredoxin-type protein NapG
MERREFVIQVAQGAAAAGGVGLGWFTLLVQQAHAAAPLRPPGALPRDDFTGTCIKCGQCVQACPYQSVRLVKTGEPGLAGTAHHRAARCALLHVRATVVRQGVPHGRAEPGACRM